MPDFNKSPFLSNGPLVTRRGVLASGLACLAVPGRGQAPAIVTSKNRVETAVCTLASEQTEGPYYVDYRLLRADVTEGRPGVPLHLQILVLDAAACKPIANAAVSIWHCDASGIYSGFTSNSPGGPPRGGGPGGLPPPSFAAGRRPPGPPPGFGFGPPRDDGRPPSFQHGPTDETRFFRGVQMTNAAGIARFATIYPGWYMGRDIHIHLKVHTQGASTAGRYTGGHVCHTGQLFFPEDISDAIARLGPYADHHTERTRQSEDDVFTSQHGGDFVVWLIQLNKWAIADGFLAKATLGVNPNQEPGLLGLGGPPPGRYDR